MDKANQSSDFGDFRIMEMVYNGEWRRGEEWRWR